ncbi:sugar transferase [Knoellia aerolata]|uniref:Sugar transferase n=1 Tax=Knoellia aerolata DSM 18566 TaxID=1385519 RepID=A0A0A0JYY6_9MICO|nr:sugar transferase [Knoellia aerolata]KGN42383.1 sugar transferase [Knoellia aerolata DSM 18566]
MSEGSRKRFFDLAVTVPALLVSLPIQALVAAAVRVKLGSPVLFMQRRPGLNGEIFTMRKFRTMRPPDLSQGLISDADRLTSFGAFLRSTSLDELPTLWNIVRGDMSLVGPRPLLVQYLGRYSPEQARRHEVRPGLTGLAQVSGRNAVSWQRRLELDVEYVDTQTLSGDLAIIGRTVAAVLRRDGITAMGDVTMPEFQPPERSR